MKKTALRIAAITITGIALAFAGTPSHAQGATMYMAGRLDCNAIGAFGRNVIAYSTGITDAEAGAGIVHKYARGTASRPASVTARSGQSAADWSIYAEPYIVSGGEDCSII